MYPNVNCSKNCVKIMIKNVKIMLTFSKMCCMSGVYCVEGVCGLWADPLGGAVFRVNVGCGLIPWVVPCSG